jgi:cyclopropane fatty-acyl-phospholipid synthase-like methyltransferase
MDNIIRYDYYDRSYFDNNISYKEGEVKFDSFFLASILKFLNPKSVLELGCGRGDVLFLLGLDPRIKVQGIDFSQAALKTVWPFLFGKVNFGDILDVCHKYHSSKITFNTFCAFDLWEHIRPEKLHDYIDSMIALAEEDALFLFNIPGFGEDRVFGEVFPLELEENRERFNRRLPFDYLNAESLNPAIPAKGHLIWAHTEWWQKQFEEHELIRAEELERNIHTYFDEHLFYARKSFYVFHLNSPAARHRVNQLTQKSLTLNRKWKLLVAQQEGIVCFLKTNRKPIIDLEELKMTINHAEFHMIQDRKKQLKRWTEKIQAHAKPGLMGELMQSLLDRLANKYLDVYLRIIKKRHYLIDKIDSINPSSNSITV